MTTPTPAPTTPAEEFFPWKLLLPALAATYTAALARIQAHILTAVLRQFHLSGSWRHDDAVEFASIVPPLVRGAQQAVSAITAAYLDRVVSEASGVRTPPVGIAPSEVTGSAVRAGVDPVVVYRRPYVVAWTDLAAGAPLPSALDKAERRIADLVNTDLQLSKTRTAQQVLTRDPRDIIGWRRIPQGTYSCALCLISSTNLYGRTKPAAIHPNCLPGTAVVSATGVQAATRRWYAGELVVIDTASGNQLTITAQHPVLTEHGWVPAGQLRQGDHLVRGPVRDGPVGGGPQQHQQPAVIQDVWDAAGVDGLVRMPLAPQDLHGDSAHGEIQVVPTHRHLPPVADRALVQQLGEALFVDGGRAAGSLHSLSPAALLLIAHDASPHGGVGGFGLGTPLIGAHAGGAYPAGVAAPPMGHPGLVQHPVDGGAGYTEPLRQGQLGFAGLVAAHHLIGRQGAPRPAARRFDAPAVQYAGEGCGAYARTGRGLLERLAGQVALDRIVELRRVDATGHVYNLHTDEGWYVADGFVVSNCDCTIEPVYGDYDPGAHLDDDFLNAVHDAIERDLGVDYMARSGRAKNTDARLFDYRDIVVEHMHGEIGPVLAVRHQKFTGPKDIPTVHKHLSVEDQLGG